jgi:hypothetical protein
MKGWSNSDVPQAGQHVPEKRLLAAVLQRAITDYISTDGDLKENARCWLFDEADSEEETPLTFDFVCEALDLEIDGLREAIELQAEIAAKNGGKVFAEMAI